MLNVCEWMLGIFFLLWALLIIGKIADRNVPERDDDY